MIELLHRQEYNANIMVVRIHIIVRMTRSM